MQYTMKTFDELTNIELYEILKLREEVFILEQACIYPDIDGKDEHAQHLMAFDHGKLVACLRILDKGVTFEESSIGRVIVSKNHRRRGIAKEMMQQAIDFIGCKMKEARIKISAQAYTIPFYESVGFNVVSGEYMEDGILHVEMVCDLSY